MTQALNQVIQGSVILTRIISGMINISQGKQNSYNNDDVMACRLCHNWMDWPELNCSYCGMMQLIVSQLSPGLQCYPEYFVKFPNFLLTNLYTWWTETKQGFLSK